MIPDLDIDVLRVVLVIAETGRFSQAARILNRTQAAVSGQVKRLEEQLGTRLFERTVRGASPTREGEVFLGYAKSIVSINETVVGIFSHKRLVERVRVGVPEGYATPFLSTAIATLNGGRGNAQLEVTCDHSPALLARLDSGGLDLVIATRQTERQDGVYLAQVPLIWVGSHQFSPTAGRPLPLALYPQGICVHRSLALDILTFHQVPWTVALTSSHLESLLVPVNAGLAVTVLTRFALREGLSEFSSHTALPELPQTHIVLHSSKHLNMSAEHLRDALLRQSWI